MEKLTWNKKFMSIAKDVSTWSKDKSRKVGAVIVKDNRIISTGYNGFAEHIDDENPKRHERPAKYSWTAHAEENAILSCARLGIATKDAVMYCTWFPCAVCARMLINAGIKKIVCGQEPDLEDSKFGGEFKIVLEMLHEADIDIEYVLQKKVFMIDIANMSPEEIDAHISRIALRFKKDERNSMINSNDEDYYIPVKDKEEFSCGCGGTCTCMDE